MRVGFVGTGNMGCPMASNVLAAGNHLRVYDIDRSSTIGLEKAGAIRCDDLGSLAGECEVILMSLPGPIEVSLVSSEILESMSAGQVLVDMSTNSPAAVKEIAAVAGAKRVDFLDAPVSGGIRGAQKGTLAIMVGGEKSIFDRMRSLLASMGSNIFYVGEVGSGNVAKLVNNMLAFSVMMANAEALILGAKAGVDPNVLWKVVKSSSGSSVVWEGGGRAILKDRLPRTFTVDLACKDIGLATELAREVGVDLTMASATERLLKDFQRNGFAQEDILATIKSLEEVAGVTLRGTWEE